MGTRASFWIGDPRNIEERKWLGCKAWDGYPSAMPFGEVKSEADFLLKVQDLSKEDDFASPEKGWPYPWADDIFMTDYTYAFFDGKVQAAYFHHGFVPFNDLSEDESEFPENDTLPGDVPAPAPYDNTQPDSIIILAIKK